jgi:hypothetical protein
MKLLRRASAVLSAAAILMVAVPAVADTRIQPYVGVTVEEVYDSNVLNSHGPDSVTRVSPRVGILADDERLTLGLEYKAALHAYLQGAADNSFNHRAAALLKYIASRRLELRAHGVLLVADDPMLLERAAVAVPQGGFIDLVLGTEASFHVTRRVRLDGGYTYRRTRFDLAGGLNSAIYDGDEHRVDGDVAWEAERRLELRATGRWQHFVSAPGDTDATGVGAGLTWNLSRPTRLILGGGPIWFTTGATWVGDARLIYLTPRFRLALQGLRDLYGGTGASQTIWTDALIGDMGWRMTRDLTFHLRAAGYQSGPAPDEAAIVSGLVGRAGVSYMIVARTVRLDVYGEHRTQDATGGLAFGNVQRTLVGVQLTYVAGADVLALGEVP